jgi:hypothetical protein
MSIILERALFWDEHYSGTGIIVKSLNLRPSLEAYIAAIERRMNIINFLPIFYLSIVNVNSTLQKCLANDMIPVTESREYPLLASLPQS